MCKNLMVRCAALGVALVFGDVALAQAEPPVTMRIHGPRAGKTGVMLTDGWSFKVSADVENAVAFVSQQSISGSQALVYDDPDGCLDMRDFLPGSLEEGCTGQDESFIEFKVDRDQPGVLDGGTAATRCPQLTDDMAIVSAGAFDNKQNLFIGDPGANVAPESLAPVGPDTGGVKMTADPTEAANDCFGYGHDDDLQGLVVIADVGAARVTDWEGNDFPGIKRVRNMAGLADRIGYEFLDKKGRSAITAEFFVDRGDLEPITFVDGSTTNFPPETGNPPYDFLLRIDGGPVEGYYYSVDPLPSFFSKYGEYSKAPPLTDFKVRAFLVDGVAPDFIDDFNLDGRIDVRDLVDDPNYTVISNEAKLRVVAKTPEASAAEIDLEYCPPGSTHYVKDLDLDASRGYNCNTGGSRGGRRVLR